MTADFRNVSILGSGLLGGSLAMALQKNGVPARLWARRPETARAAIETGITAATPDLGFALADADLVVLAVPVGAMPSLVSQALAAGLRAGCMITEGMVKRGAKVRLLRDNVVIHEGTLKTLRRFKDEVREVQQGYECGMAFENYQDIRPGDVIEAFEIEEVARVL
jgi:predicted dinucleotide-utilizing enzyme